MKMNTMINLSSNRQALVISDGSLQSQKLFNQKVVAYSLLLSLLSLRGQQNKRAHSKQWVRNEVNLLAGNFIQSRMEWQKPKDLATLKACHQSITPGFNHYQIQMSNKDSLEQDVCPFRAISRLHLHEMKRTKELKLKISWSASSLKQMKLKLTLESSKRHKVRLTTLKNLSLLVSLSLITREGDCKLVIRNVQTSKN